VGPTGPTGPNNITTTTTTNLTGFLKGNGSLVSADNNTYALDNAVVKLTGAQTASGEKTFTNGVRTGSGTQSWQIESQAGSNLLFRSGSSPVTRMTLSTSGVLTATTFSGSGSSLTSLPALQLTGTVSVLRLGSSGTRNSTTYLNGNNQ
jgi:hypothetical protein